MVAVTDNKVRYKSDKIQDTYIVKKGDTLYSIANNYNISVNDIRKFRAENLEKIKTVKSKLQMRKKNIQLLKNLIL